MHRRPCVDTVVIEDQPFSPLKDAARQSRLLEAHLVEGWFCPTRIRSDLEVQ